MFTNAVCHGAPRLWQVEVLGGVVRAQVDAATPRRSDAARTASAVRGVW